MVARLFQPSAKSGLRLMISVKVSMAASVSALGHLLHPDLEEGVHLGVARSAPRLPDGVLGKGPHEVVGIAELPEEGGEIVGGRQLAQPRGGEAARLNVGRGEILERLLVGQARLVLGARPDDLGEAESDGHGEGEGLHVDRPMRVRNCSFVQRRRLRAASRRRPWSPDPRPPRRSPSSSRPSPSRARPSGEWRPWPGLW